MAGVERVEVVWSYRDGFPGVVRLSTTGPARKQ